MNFIIIVCAEVGRVDFGQHLVILALFKNSITFVRFKMPFLSLESGGICMDFESLDNNLEVYKVEFTSSNSC